MSCPPAADGAWSTPHNSTKERPTLTSIAGAAGQIVGGVDTHRDLHHATVVDLLGEIVDTRSFATTRAGYRAMLAWMRLR